MAKKKETLESVEAAVEQASDATEPTEVVEEQVEQVEVIVEQPPVIEQPQASHYTRDQFLQSGKTKDRDLLAALLEEDKTYTKAEAAEIVKRYKEGSVK